MPSTFNLMQVKLARLTSIHDRLTRRLFINTKRNRLHQTLRNRNSTLKNISLRQITRTRQRLRALALKRRAMADAKSLRNLTMTLNSTCRRINSRNTTRAIRQLTSTLVIKPNSLSSTVNLYSLSQLNSSITRDPLKTLSNSYLTIRLSDSTTKSKGKILSGA